MMKRLALLVMQHTAASYRRALWGNQPHYVEVWVEKEALAGTLYEVTSPFDVGRVPFAPNRL